MNASNLDFLTASDSTTKKEITKIKLISTDAVYPTEIYPRLVSYYASDGCETNRKIHGLDKQTILIFITSAVNIMVIFRILLV
jgi:hypothetical protein